MRSVPRLNAALGFAMLWALFVLGVTTFYDPDMWHGLALAREIHALGGVPMRDVFSYTATRHPVVHHEWLSALLLYEVMSRGGALAFALAKHLLNGSVLALALAVAWRQGARIATIVTVAPIGIVLLWGGMTSIRAQVFTLLLVGALLLFLDLDRRGRRWWMVPCLLLHGVWLNLHGGFVVGPALIAVHMADQWLRRQPVRHLMGLEAACLLLIAANPYGLSYYAYLWEALRLDRSVIAEWTPLWRHAAWQAVGVYALSVAIWAAAALRAEKRPAGLLLVVVSAVAALRHQRHAAIYGVVWLGQVLPMLERVGWGAAVERVHGRWPLAATGWLLAMLLALGSTVFARRPWQLILPANPGEGRIIYPVGAVEYLDERGFHGKVMVPFEIGAWVSWKLHPAVLVSLDGRYEAAYAPELLSEHLRFFAAEEGWREARDKEPADLLLVPAEAPVVQALRAEGRWHAIYRDDAYWLFARPGLLLPARDRRGERLTGTFP